MEHDSACERALVHRSLVARLNLDVDDANRLWLEENEVGLCWCRLREDRGRGPTALEHRARVKRIVDGWAFVLRERVRQQSGEKPDSGSGGKGEWGWGSGGRVIEVDFRNRRKLG